METAIEPLRSRTQQNRRENPSSNPTDQERERWRKVGECPDEHSANDGAEEQRRRWDRYEPDARSLLGTGPTLDYLDRTTGHAAAVVPWNSTHAVEVLFARVFSWTTPDVLTRSTIR
jgi:hypothetical protein